MGKKKVALVDLSQGETAELKATGVRSQKISFKVKKPQEPEPKPIQGPTLKAEIHKRIRHGRSKRYLEAKAKLTNETYPIDEAVKLLKAISRVKFDPSVELHLNLLVDKVGGELQLPHGTGKTVKVEIASEKTLVKLNDDKIDFDILIAAPMMMPKLAKYAKILGPKGLMPNPKAGTITDDPVKAAQQWQGKAQFKTEIKAPLIHLAIGKVNTPAKQLEENFLVLVAAVGPKNITKAVLAPTMGPGIKVAL